MISTFYEEDLNKITSASGMIQFFSNYAISILLFSYPYIPMQGITGLIGCLTIISMVCYYFGLLLFSYEKKANNVDRNNVLQARFHAHLQGKSYHISQEYDEDMAEL